MKIRNTIFTFLPLIFLMWGSVLYAQFGSLQESEKFSAEEMEWNNQIRREKFDIILPRVMRKNNVDMWIHIMRDAISDPFGENDLGSASGVFVFTDKGDDRIERAVLGRRWGNSQRGWSSSDSNFLEDSGAYDIIEASVFVTEPLSEVQTEYDHRFEGLREFVEARDPKVIAVNYRENLGPWTTSQKVNDGISLTDYRLLVKELGEKYAGRIVSSEYLLMDYQVSPVPSEVKLLKKMRRDEMEMVNKAFASVIPGKTMVRGDLRVTTLRRMSTGLSQRGRSAGWENAVIERGDMVTAPSQGKFAYILREGEIQPPAEIKKLWAEYLKIEKIFVETIKVGRTPREIVKDYKKKFDEAGFIVQEYQLHMFQPKNDFPEYSIGLDPNKTQISIDLHGKGMGATGRKHDIYLGPRIGSYGPEWVLDVPLVDNHHFVLEYFFYMPSPGPKGKDQYLLFWNHEQAIVTENGVEYLSPPQKELILIKN